MKNIAKLLIIICCIPSLFLQGCVDETFPTNTATEDQLGASAKATEALLWAMPAYTNKYNVLGSTRHSDFGYPSMMHIRDVMTADMTIYDLQGYNVHFSSWMLNQYQGEKYVYAQFIWNYYWKFIQTSNNMIAAVKPETASPLQLNYLGVGHAFRALAYLDLARMCEFLENDKTNPVNDAGNNVLNLTIPIVKEDTDEKTARNNPRVTREEMYKFILSDLELAEEYLTGFSRSSKTLPDMGAVYGLRARLHLWVEEYANAKTYARKAIDAGYTPTTKAQWLDAKTGFNTLSTSSWIWGIQIQKEDDVVKSGIINWTSWMSNETTFGYAGAGAKPVVDKRFYDRIDDNDFRKLSWKAPAGSALDGKNIYVNAAFANLNPDYASLKFRPGQGNYSDYNVAAACAIPLMRVEEMYFIEAEAAAQINPTDGVNLLNNFMQTHRNSSYNYTASEKDEVIDEIFFQKRVELWGEGLNFFDYKRLNKPVIRGYEGTNHSDVYRFNTTTRPAWMNISIVQTEKNNNKALIGYENPDPSDLYTPWKATKE